MVDGREYLDTHHSWVSVGRDPLWPALGPPTGPRLWPETTGTAGAAIRPPDNIERETRAFDLDPRMLADPRPSGRPSDAAGREANLALIDRLHEALTQGDPDAVGACFAPDFRHFIAGDAPFGWNHSPLEQIYAPLVARLASPIRVRVGPPIGDAAHVIAEMEIRARLDDGTYYQNWHCLIYRIENGLIAEIREYLDTHHAWVVLGRFADWGRTPTPQLRRARRSNLPSIEMSTQIPPIWERT